MNDMGGKSIIWLGDNHPCKYELRTNCGLQSILCLIFLPVCSLYGIWCNSEYRKMCWGEHDICNECGRVKGKK